MKKFLQALILVVLTSGAANAQLADGSTAPNFQMTDINGQTHDLYSYLDSGYVVFVDIFATWCPPCWTLHDGHVLENLYNEYGPHGTNEIRVIAVEGDDDTSNADLFGTGSNTLGDWTAGISYPIGENNSVPGMFNLGFWPTIVMIRPNRATLLVNDECFDAFFQSSNAPLTDIAVREDNDLGLASFDEDVVVECSQPYPSVDLTNFGNVPLTSATVDLVLDGEVLQSVSWVGDLGTFQSETIVFDEVDIHDQMDFDFAGSLPNGETDNWQADNSSSRGFSRVFSTLTLEFSIRTDFWPEEISWRLWDETDNVVLYSNADFGTLGCDELYEQTWTLDQTGCYRFEIEDSFGDGLLNTAITPGTHGCTTPNGQANQAMGSIEISGELGVLFDDIEYDDGTAISFEAMQSSGISTLDDLENLVIFPNPTQDRLHLTFELASAKDINYEIFNVLGERVYNAGTITYGAGANNIEVNVSDLRSGTYFIKMAEDNKLITKTFQVIR